MTNFLVLMKASGVAEGVVVQSTGAVDDGTTVQFYSSSDCSTRTELSSSNAGCISIDNELVGAYQSFKVIHTGAQKRRRDILNSSFRAVVRGTTPPPPMSL
jgi:hypothetical protein